VAARLVATATPAEDDGTQDEHAAGAEAVHERTDADGADVEGYGLDTEGRGRRAPWRAEGVEDRFEEHAERVREPEDDERPEETAGDDDPAGVHVRTTVPSHRRRLRGGG